MLLWRKLRTRLIENSQIYSNSFLFSVVITTPFYKPPSLAFVIGGIALISPNDLIFLPGIMALFIV